MSTTPGTPADYSQLLTGDYGFLIALEVTLLTCVFMAFAIKIYFTYERLAALRRTRQIGTAAIAVMTSDAIWFIAHIFAFVSFAVRFPSLKGLTSDSSLLSESAKVKVGHDNLVALVFFILAIYLSSCSVLCAAIAIPNVAMSQNDGYMTATYIAPVAVFIMGCLLATLPRIGCNPTWIFPGHRDLCPSPAARVLPVIFLIVVIDLALVIHWFNFMYRRAQTSNVGRVTRRQDWPVAPFALRLIVCGANIAYAIVLLHAGRSHNPIPYYLTIYPQLLSLGLSLLATSSVSLSRILGKLNFSGVAYHVDPGAHTMDKSGVQSGSRRIIGNSSGHRGSQIGAPDRGETKESHLVNGEEVSDGWRDQSARIQSKIRAGRKGSADSDEVQMLGQDSIKWTVDIHQHTERDEGSTVSNTTRGTRE